MNSDSDSIYSSDSEVHFKSEKYVQYNSKKKQESYKKILCLNMLTINKCSYANNCLYAHTLEEQQINTIRKLAYAIIKNEDTDYSYINIYEDKVLYKNLSSLSNICYKCISGLCTGGYNCKYGVCKKEYQICDLDMNNGKCSKQCGKVHITKRNIKPYFSHILENNMKKKNSLNVFIDKLNWTCKKENTDSVTIDYSEQNLDFNSPIFKSLHPKNL